MRPAPFTALIAVAAPLLRSNVDTDAIIPSREIRTVSKSGLAAGLFAGWRYTTIGGREPDPTFVLNDPKYRGAQILLGGENFGCGSSREHAVWALAEYGFRAIVAPSFNPIFEGNCTRNGVVPVRLELALIEMLAETVAQNPQERRIAIDLGEQTVRGAGMAPMTFKISTEAKSMLMTGSDAIDLTLVRGAEIAEFVAADRIARPWAYL